jgi:hypothetical protein
VQSHGATKPHDGIDRYQYRNLPCNVSDPCWFVQGDFRDPSGHGGGVLEWCYDEQDARERLTIMQTYPEFSNLTVGQWD